VEDGNVGPGSTTSGWLEQVRVKDPAAWQRLVRLYGPLVYGWARHSGLQAEDAADVVQEVFRAVLVHVADFRRDRPGDTFRGWLRAITHNKLRDFWRRGQGKPRAAGGSEAQRQLQEMADPLACEVAEAEEPAPGSLLHRALDLIRLEFEDKSWQAFYRVTVEGRQPADVATELGMTTNAIYVARSRILRRLREELGDEFDS
jgi:RNA polymerase sigma-70 factor, ECF subfamily